MAFQWWCLLVLAAFCHVSMSQSDHFNCASPGHDCNSGSCEDRSCWWCPGNMTGYDCGFDSTGYVQDDCDHLCRNGGTCYRSATTYVCLCPPDFYDNDCSTPRVRVECGGEYSQVSFNPITPFTGIVYLGGDPYNETCQLKNGSDGHYRIGGNAMSSDCNLTMSTNNGNTSYTSQLNIQYDTNFQSVHDLTIDVSCVHLANSTWESTSGFKVRKRSNENNRGRDVEDIYFPVKLEFLHADEDVVESVILGERIAMVNSLTETTVYQTLRVESCTFSNPLVSKSVQVIEDGCPTDRSLVMDMANGKYVPPWFYVYQTQGIWHKFNVIRFGTEPLLVVSCRIRLCKENNKLNNSACDLPNCASRSKRDVDAVNRVRRETVEPADKEQIVSNTLNVFDFNIEEERARMLTADKCLEQPVIKSVGISLFVVLFLMVLICVILVFCLCRARFALREKLLERRYMNHNGAGTPDKRE